MFVAPIVFARCHVGIDEDRRGWVGLNKLLDEVVVTATVHDDDVSVVDVQLVLGRSLKRVWVLVGVVNQRSNRGGVASDKVRDRTPNVGAGHDLDRASAGSPLNWWGGAAGERES